MFKQDQIIGAKELRQNLDKYIDQIAKGKSFTVVRRSRPIFNIIPLNTQDNWEEIIDFTKIKKGGIKIEEVLARL